MGDTSIDDMETAFFGGKSASVLRSGGGEAMQTNMHLVRNHERQTSDRHCKHIWTDGNAFAHHAGEPRRHTAKDSEKRQFDREVTCNGLHVPTSYERKET